MEQSNQNILSDYNSRGSRLNRFKKLSKEKSFLVETHHGNFLFPNEFCAMKEDKFNDNYFCLKRDGERFKSLVVSFSRIGLGFSIYQTSGLIVDYWAEIERQTRKANFVNLAQFEQDLNQNLKSIFTNFYITF